MLARYTRIRHSEAFPRLNRNETPYPSDQRRLTTMNTGFWIKATNLGLLLGILNCHPIALADSEGEGAWEILFDGTSTEHFRVFRGKDFPAESWKVESGTLQALGNGPSKDIVSRKSWQNFELVFEWKVAEGANSGIMYRVSEKFNQPWFTGPEFQILDDAKHGDGKRPITFAGSFYALVSPQGEKPRPVGQFNDSRIIVQGNRVEHWLNGHKIVALDLDSYAVTQLIQQSKFSRMPRFAKEPSGVLCFQHHGDDVWFRNIKVRSLPPADEPAPAQRPNRLSQEQREAGWQNLFNGRDARHWRGFLKEEFPERGWSIENETLIHAAGGGGGGIVTRKRYGQFDFRFEWRVAEGANSGVKYFILEQERKQQIGHEYQILDDERHPDARRGTTRQTAAFYDCLSAQNRVLRPVQEFNQSRILVLTDRVEHWLNGVMVLQYELEGEELNAAIAKSKFRNVADFGKFHRARILLQDHGDEVAWRNLRIKNLE